MNKDERAQIGLILTHEFDQALRRANKFANEIFAKHSVAGRLQSNVTISEILRMIVEDLTDLLDRIVEQVGSVSRERRAASLIQVAFSEHMDKLLNGEFRRVASIVSGDGSSPPKDDIWQLAKRFFEQATSDLETKLRIFTRLKTQKCERFQFT